MRKLYHLVAAAGTFDRLHKGHQAFLTQAFAVGERVLVGLTKEEMLKDKLYPMLILSYNKRLEELKKFLKEKDWLSRVDIIPIKDIYGPAAKQAAIEAIVVTKKTEANAQKINRERIKNGLTPLIIIATQLIAAIDGAPIASHRIRAGIQDRLGRVFTLAQLALAPRVLDDQHRARLKQPLGRFFLGSKRNLKLAVKQAIPHLPKNCPLVVTVGDMVTQSLLKIGLVPQLAIVDLQVQRKRLYQKISDLDIWPKAKVFETLNPPGQITKELFFTIEKVMREHRLLIRRGKLDPKTIRVIYVEGEEDLATLPAVLLAPLSSVVIYGQPPIKPDDKAVPEVLVRQREGVVMVEVTEEKKREVFDLLLSLPKGH